MKLDRIDKSILSDLQESGRMTNVDLAKRAGISAPPCLRRVRALEDAGLIDSYHAKLNNAALGYTVTVIAHVALKSHAEEDLNKFEEHLNELDMVREAYMMAGDMDFMIKVVAKDWDDYQKFHKEKLTSFPNVSAVKSSLSIRATKYKPGVPVE